MSKNRFWQALERCGVGATVEEWRRETGFDFEIVRRWLRPLARKALTYPVCDEWGNVSHFDVVEHSPTDIVAVCQESGDRKALAPKDIVLDAVDREAIRRELVRNLQLEAAPPDAGTEQCPHAGTVSHAGERIWVSLCWRSDPDDMLSGCVDWAAGVNADSVLLTLTRSGWGRQLPAFMDKHGMRLVALSDTIAVESNGTWQCDPSLLAFLGGVSESGSSSVPTFRWDGGRWEIAFDGRTDHPPDIVGMHYIRFLLAEPRRRFAPHELVERRTGIHATPTKSRQTMLDAEGLRTLKARLVGLSSDRAEAEANGDQLVLEEIDEETSKITAELERSRGIGRRSRTLETGDGKQRKPVANAIDRAIDEIRQRIPRLAEHLQAFIARRGGLQYAPDAPIEWRT